ncbi:hypothetical protein BG006_003382 [Podila minutissima]|uniref:Uncharacterized protein n=1 Tax=Podila minutissima TaxID=64525 RepID=A0A9P5SQI5_9FUNG|nr:hypothetical protein BG006_003382 [Podila minutissima]
MNVTPSCELPWIEAAVNRYLASPPPNFVGHQAQFQMCCNDPENCTVSRPGSPDQSVCNLGSLLCTLGSQSYVCRFNPSKPGPIVPAGPTPSSNVSITLPAAGTGNTVCYHEGRLAKVRLNLPCCRNELPNFLKSSDCLDVDGNQAAHSNVCCQGGSCQFGTTCPKEASTYMCHSGYNNALCWGVPADGSSDFCILEARLMPFYTKPGSGCKKVSGWLIFGEDTEDKCLYTGKNLQSSPTKNAPPPTKTSGGRALSPKTLYMAAFLAASLLQQLLFL